jgi:hypothetical protein
VLFARSGIAHFDATLKPLDRLFFQQHAVLATAKNKITGSFFIEAEWYFRKPEQETTWKI